MCAKTSGGKHPDTQYHILHLDAQTRDDLVLFERGWNGEEDQRVQFSAAVQEMKRLLYHRNPLCLASVVSHDSDMEDVSMDLTDRELTFIIGQQL